MSTETRIPEHVPAELVRDFSIEFCGPLGDLFPRLDQMREEGRVLWLPAEAGRMGALTDVPGVWLFTKGDDIRNALQQPDVFSSRIAGDGVVPAMIPVFLDPPDHTRYRRLLNPLFTGPVVQDMEAGMRARMNALVDDVLDEGGCDFVADVAVQFPTRVFTSWVGLPVTETGRFVAMVRALMHDDDGDVDREAMLFDAFVVLEELVTARVAEPTDDLMSQIVTQQLDGRPLTHDEMMRIAFLLFLAGLDTVVAALSFSFWHLAQTPGDRQALQRGDVTVGDAVEELLRRHAFLNLPRLVTRDTEFAGVALKAGDAVVLATPLASRDPDEFDDPTVVHLDREQFRQYAFGLGPHRCLGSHLARLEMRVALEEWHARIPDYELAGEAGGYGGTVMGVSTLPLRW